MIKKIKLLFKKILLFIFFKNKIKARNNLDIAMLITDAILNEFEKNGKVNIPLDEHKYSFDLQDTIQLELERIANEDMINDNTKSIGE